MWPDCSSIPPRWAIRNCGVMLYKALIDRIFGTSEPDTSGNYSQTKHLSKFSWGKYPKLARILIKLLERGLPTNRHTSGAQKESHARTSSVEIVFPALEIVRRAGPPPGQHDSVYRVVFKHLSSNIWLVRAMAGRTLCVITAERNLLEQISLLLGRPQESQNLLHGTLLTAKNMVQRLVQLSTFSSGACHPCDLGQFGLTLNRRFQLSSSVT